MMEHGNWKWSAMYYVDYWINKFEIHHLEYPEELNWTSCENFV